jgi:hypothetical protein
MLEGETVPPMKGVWWRKKGSDTTLENATGQASGLAIYIELRVTTSNNKHKLPTRFHKPSGVD